MEPLFLQFLAFLAIVVLVYEARRWTVCGVAIVRRSLKQANARHTRIAKQTRVSALERRTPSATFEKVDPDRLPSAPARGAPVAIAQARRPAPTAVRRRGGQAGWGWLALIAVGAAAAIVAVMMSKPTQTRPAS